jgi:hypothetical protein
MGKIMTFTAKANTWYDEGSIAIIVCHVHDDWYLMQGFKDDWIDEEICSLNEFEVLL